jgi:hypothetical protein
MGASRFLAFGSTVSQIEFDIGRVKFIELIKLKLRILNLILNM